MMWTAFGLLMVFMLAVDHGMNLKARKILFLLVENAYVSRLPAEA